MKRTEFQAVARMRVREAKALLDAGHSPGAYYLVGYSVECALKACVARQVRRCDFPDKKLANEAWTHNLEQLIRVAGLGPVFENARRVNPALDVNWAIVKDWNEESRYEVHISKAQARDLYSASVGRNGVLPWIKRQW
ncbi:MAG TPA: DNA-binding protein [Dehalococcoidia bacterium]|nr:DNA-binding protein [Dehalococcoidia bacterium]